MVRGRQMSTGSNGVSASHFRLLAAFIILAPCLFHQTTWAQQQEPALGDFIGAIQAGLALQDEAARANVLMDLYYFEGADEEVRDRQRRILESLFKDSTVTFKEVVPLAELSEYVADGVRYGPNLAPSGYAVLEVMPAAASQAHGLDFTTKIPFGRSDDGRYRFIAMVKLAITIDAPEDAWITIMLSGVSAGGGRLAFSGSCMLRQSDGTDRLIRIDDEGLPSHSVGWRGIGVTQCLIEKTAGPGALRLQLMRDDEELFDQTFHEDTPATFPRR